MATEMEIICVGNELLIGKTLNTNASWMAKRSTSLGVAVKRVTVVGDDVEEISVVVAEALKRKPKFVITTGGLGPTFDDRTLEGIAKALKKEVEVNDKALGMVKEKYDAFVREGRIEKAELTSPRVKMAKLPKGAKPLNNPTGTAPAVLMKIRGTTLIALPGVPSEMEAIFEESIAHQLRMESENAMFFETSIFVDDIMESALAPLVDRTMHDNEYVYIKSHPKGEENVPHIELHFSMTSKDGKDAKAKLGKAIVQLSDLIEKKGGKIRAQKKNR